MNNNEKKFQNSYFNISRLSIILMNESFIIVHGTNTQTIAGVSADKKYFYTVERIDKGNNTKLHFSLKNNTNKVYHDINFRFYCYCLPKRIDDAYIYNQTAEHFLVVGNSEKWNKFWKPNENHDFTITFNQFKGEGRTLNNIIKNFSLLEDYNGYEQDETVTLDEMKGQLTKEDFDLSDGIDNLSSQAQKVYKSLPAEKDNDTQKKSKPRKIRWKAPKYPLKRTEYTLFLDGCPAQKGHNNNGEKYYVIQGYHVGSKYIYVTNKKRENKHNVLYIHRLKKNKADTAAYYNASMKIIDGGHGQTLDLYDHKGKTYFLVDLNSGSNGNDWGTQIGRVEFVPNKTINALNISRLTYLNYSKDSINSFGRVYRADGAVSTDRKFMLIWKRNDSGKTECTIHKLDVINNELDYAKENNILAVSFQYRNSTRSIQSFRNAPYMGSRSQGVDLSNKDSNGLFSIYWSLGDESKERKALQKNKAQHRLGVKRYTSNGSFKADIHVLRNAIFSGEMEMEAVRIPQSGNFVRILLVPCSGLKNQQYLCRIDKRALE